VVEYFCIQVLDTSKLNVAVVRYDDLDVYVFCKLNYMHLAYKKAFYLVAVLLISIILKV
jgi:hypothetical protein